LPPVPNLLRDVQHGFRMMGRMPGVAAVVILSLGVGIGVNTAIFSWTEMLVLKPLPAVADAASFHAIEPRTEAGTHPGSSWLEYRDLRERLTTLRDVIAFRMVPFYVGEADRTERSYGLLVSGNYFTALGLRPAAGRFLEANDESSEAAESAIVISYDSVPRPARASGRSMNPPACVPCPTPNGFHDAPPERPTSAPMSPMSGSSSWYSAPAEPWPDAGGGGTEGAWARHGAVSVATRAGAASQRKGRF